MNELYRRILYLPPQASTIAAQVDALHYFVLTVTMLGSFGVAAVTTWYIYRYIRRDEAQKTGVVRVTFTRELLTYGGLLVLFLTFWVIGFRQYVRMQLPPEGSIEIYVIAKQWMWKFGHTNGHSSIGVLTVPVGRPVKLVMTSRDMIHSFYVPAFRIKMDVIPGRYTIAWFEATQVGRYDIFCTEYCGLSHSRMRAEVVVLSPQDYEQWLERSREPESPVVAAAVEGTEEFPREGTASDLVALGRNVAAKRQCLACHTLDGQKHVGPTFKGLYLARIPLENGKETTADDAYLTRSMMDPRADIHRGFSPVMPSYQGVLSAPETAALVELIRSLRDTSVSSGVSLPKTEALP